MTENENKEILIYSTTWCSDCKRAKKFLGEQRIAYVNIDIEENPQYITEVERLNNGMRSVPTIVFPDGTILSEPSNAELAQKLGLQTVAQRKFYDVIIVGGGTTGLTAAIYLSREGMDTLVIERGALGGQVGMTQMMDNFPGFDQGISGSDFADRLVRQARRFGVEILQATEVIDISKEETGYLAVTTRGEKNYGCKAVLFATGARYRRLGVPGEDALIGSQVHFCATCDGAFYRDKKVLVVGGGNSGFEEGLYLTKFARQVDIVEFMPQVRASKLIQDKVATMDNMKVTLNHSIKELVVKDKNKLHKIIAIDRANGTQKEWDYDGIFIFIGLEPNSDLLKDKVEIDTTGFVVTDKTLQTDIPGLYAAGDVRSGSTKQAASAAGEGATAALMIRDYVREIG